MSYRSDWILPFRPHLAARLIYVNVFILIFHHFIRSLNTSFSSSLNLICSCLIPVFILLCRPRNLLLILVHVFLEKNLYDIISKIGVAPHLPSLMFTYNVLAQCAYFSLGNSNSISTLDVGPGFTALNDYDFFAVSFQVILQTYSFWIYWLLMLFVRLAHNSYCNRTNVPYQLNLLLLVRTLCMSSFELIALNLRNHLFIWSVICPKLMYELVHTAMYVIVFALVYLVNLSA